MTTAQAIVDLFEALLDEKGISIPCADPTEEHDRHANGNFARIYGTEYGTLTDKIDAMLSKTQSNLTIEDVLRIVNGLPKKNKEITLTVNTVPVNRISVVKDVDEHWHVDMISEQ